MRVELMVEAICWDTDSKVTAEYVHGMDELSTYCPHPGCLAEVIAKFGGKNFYFAAPDRHVSGCPNEPPEVKNKDTTTVPNRKHSVVPDAPAPVPTELGPGRRPKKKKSKPSRAELLALAGTLVKLRPRCAGTLEEVVSARQSMARYAREKNPLLIREENLTYDTGFFFLGSADQMAKVPFGTKVVHGAATISYEKDNRCFWLKTLKLLETPDGKKNPLKMRVAEASAAGEYIKQLFPGLTNELKCTLFYSGSAPTLSSSGKSYLLSSDVSDDYWRFVLRPD